MTVPVERRPLPAAGGFASASAPEAGAAPRERRRGKRISLGVLDEVGRDFGLRLVVPGLE